MPFRSLCTRGCGIPRLGCRNEESSIGTIDSGKGFDLVFLRNVCYDSESSRVLLFGDHLDKSLLASVISSTVFSASSHVEVPRSNFFAVVDGKYPEAGENSETSGVGSYLLLADDAMDLVSQFASLNFIVHFAHHAMRYPSVRPIHSLHRRCFASSSPSSPSPRRPTPTSTSPSSSTSTRPRRPSTCSTRTTCLPDSPASASSLGSPLFVTTRPSPR